MLRRALIVTSLLLVGCTAPRASAVIVGDAAGARASVHGTESTPAEAPPAHDAATGGFPVLAPDPEAPRESSLSMLRTATPKRPRHRERMTLKGGYYGSSEDGLDDGYIVAVAWMRAKSETFATEFELGYLDASGSDNGVDRDVWSIPLLVNGRFNVPVGKKLELYGGVGFGSFYYEADAKTAGVKVSADGFLFGGDAFFGGALHLGQALSLGLEGKYYLTDNVSDLGGGLDAYVVMLTLGFDR